ncbi:6-phosphogluconolactonase [Synechococcus elongatus]|nr:6-phosphogluconolactonase [Synechococcus elongatus]WKW06110.1 6-phosphogluconolactonase [Synechococcus elongatus PCC 7942 = FACHB-805]BAD79182.1 6-phosphogluconolactonase [Synechococcus elongatus PCC 6301]
MSRHGINLHNDHQPEWNQCREPEMSVHQSVLADFAAVVSAAQTLVLETASRAIAERGTFRLALSGGSTPKALYEQLATSEADWANWQIFWGDERYVPNDHPDSNERMARQAWLDQVPIPAEQIHPLPTQSADPWQDAAIAETDLRRAFQVQEPAWPVFDLVLLGLGDDGHTASLFPGTAALEEQSRLVTVGDRGGQPRLTFTAPLINQARTVVFLVSGAAKQEALKRALAATGDSQQTPVRLIQPVTGQLYWLLDRDAAVLL